MAPKRKLHAGSRGAAAKESAKTKRNRTEADTATKLYTPKDLILVLGDGGNECACSRLPDGMVCIS